MNQVLSTQSFKEDTIIAGGHPAVVLSTKLLATLGALVAGLILGNSSTAGVRILWEELTETIGAGDAAETNFSGIIAHHPIEPLSLSITDTAETFADDGNGRLVGDAEGSGTINYETGAFDITFNAAPANAQDIDATNHNQMAGALATGVDTANSEAGLRVVHGSVRLDRLKKGAAAAALTTTDVDKLIARGIYPV